MAETGVRALGPTARIVVVGGGVSGLAAAHWICRELPSAHVTVLERSAQPGGTARTDLSDGYVIDRGPSGFLGSAKDLPELVRSAGLAEELQEAAPHAKRRFLFKDGRLQAAPSTPLGFLTTGLLGPVDKARVLLEPFARARPAGIDETVHDFAARRLGRGFADTFVAAMVRGVTAGDARSSSLAALFPKMRAMEDEHGGLVRALVATRRAGRNRAPNASGPAGPGGRLTSFRNGGMQRLAGGLAATPGVHVETNVEVVGIQNAAPDRGYRVTVATGESLPADTVVVATPAHVTARLLAPLAPELAPDLEAIPYAGARVLALGFARSDVPHDLDGFGFLVPPGEGLRMLGCQWSSSLFPDQAPPGKVLLQVIGGGVSDPGFVAAGDDEALSSVRAELQRTMGIEAAPDFAHQIRWQKAIPQYTVGHGDRVERIMAGVARHAGLHVTGNAYYGVGLDACVRHARQVAAQVIGHTSAR